MLVEKWMQPFTLYPPLILDKAEVKGLQALQLSQGMVPEGVMGILGMDVLSRFHFRLDPARRELQLLPPQPLPDGDRTFPILNGKVFA